MLTQEIFDEFFDYLCEMRSWQLSDKARVATYGQIASMVDDENFGSIISGLLELDYCKPADLVRACKNHQMQARHAAPPPALPPASTFKGCDEQIKFHRIGAFLSSPDRNRCDTCVPGHCACWAQLFSQPITAAERDAFGRSSITNPVAAAMGGTPAPDPKEEDLVWR